MGRRDHHLGGVGVRPLNRPCWLYSPDNCGAMRGQLHIEGARADARRTNRLWDIEAIAAKRSAHCATGAPPAAQGRARVKPS